MKKYIASIVLMISVITLVFVFPVEAQIAPPALPSSNTQQVPITGGLGILAFGGGMYALKKLKNRKNN